MNLVTDIRNNICFSMRFVIEIPFQLILVEDEQSQIPYIFISLPVVNIFDDDNVCLDGIMNVRYTFSLALCVWVWGKLARKH